MTRSWCIATLLVVLSVSARAQRGASVVSGTVDQVLAVVGNSIVLRSDVDEQTVLHGAQYPGMTPQELRKLVLQSLVEKKLLLAKALADSVQITDEEVDQKVEERLQQMIAEYGSEARIEELAHMPVSKMRRDFHDQMREELLANEVVRKKFSTLTVSERDLEEFYRAYRDSLPVVPPQVHLARIVVYSAPSATAKEDARAKAQRIRDSVKRGSDFATLAKTNSDDPVSAASGGDLGEVGRGAFVKAFEDAMFRLKEGEVSDPVETQFGFHIIQVVTKKENRVHVRHILVKIGRTQSDDERALLRAKELRIKALAGENFAELAKQFSDDKDSRGFGGDLGYLEASKIGSLGAEIKTAIDKLDIGGVTEPLKISPNPQTSGYQIIKLIERRAEHKISLATDEPRIREFAMLWKQEKEYRQWMSELQKTIYIDIKTPLK